MKKILILANNDVGLYKFRKELIIELLVNYEVYISLPQGEYIQPFIDLGCHYIDTSIDRRGANLINDIRLFLFYIRLFRNVQPDIIFTYTVKPNIYGGFAAQINRIPYVTNITGLGTSVENSGVMEKIVMTLYKFSLAKVQTVFFQNTKNRQMFIDRNIAVGKHQLLPGSGVNLNEYPLIDYPKNDGIHFVFISRVMKDKGIDEYIESAKYIKRKYPQTYFHVCGLLEEEYEEILNELHQSQIINFHGMLKDVREILKITHCTVHPSYHEGMSNVLLESAASGRPVLASNIPGCQEIFDEGRTGLGFESKNTESLIEKLESFINLSYEERKHMGVCAREKIMQDFDRRIVVEAYVKEVR